MRTLAGERGVTAFEGKMKKEVIIHKTLFFFPHVTYLFYDLFVLSGSNALFPLSRRTSTPLALQIPRAALIRGVAYLGQEAQGAQGAQPV